MVEELIEALENLKARYYTVAPDAEVEFGPMHSAYRAADDLVVRARKERA
jgi:hypothetical protein